MIHWLGWSCCPEFTLQGREGSGPALFELPDFAVSLIAQMFSLPRLLTSLSLLISSEATRLLPRILFGCEPGALLAGKGEKAWQVSCECRPGLVLALLSRAAVPQAGHSLAGLSWDAVPQKAREPWGLVPLCVCVCVALWRAGNSKGRRGLLQELFKVNFWLRKMVYF